MAIKETTKIKKAALKQVNVIRKAFGLKALVTMPKGIVQDADSCPVAVALGKRVTGVDEDLIAFTSAAYANTASRALGNGQTEDEDMTTIITPDEIASFIYGFDAGNFPELVAA